MSANTSRWGENPIRLQLRGRFARCSESHPGQGGSAAVLRIDETSGTLVAPQASSLVQESPPDCEELLSLVTSSWEPFATELGTPKVKLLAREPVPYVDLLGFDEEAQRLVVVLVTGATVRWQGRAGARAR